MTSKNGAVNYSEMFGDSALPFLQAAYDSCFEFLYAMGIALADEKRPVQHKSDSQYFVKASGNDVEILTLIVRPPKTDESYRLNVLITFTYTYYDAAEPAREDMWIIYKYDYDGRKAGRTIDAFIRGEFEQRIKCNPLGILITLINTDIESDYSDGDRSYWATFDLSFRVDLAK